MAKPDVFPGWDGQSMAGPRYPRWDNQLGCCSTGPARGSPSPTPHPAAVGLCSRMETLRRLPLGSATKTTTTSHEVPLKANTGPQTSLRHHGAGQSKGTKRKQHLRGLGAGMRTASLAAGGEEPSLPLPEEEEGTFLPFSRLVTLQPIHQVIYS